MAVQTRNRMSRNAACPCGSGKKYKRCCLPEVRDAELRACVAPRFANRFGGHPRIQRRTATWKRVVCQGALRNGRFLVLTLAYRAESVGRAGQFLTLDLPEIGFRGDAFVMSIQETSLAGARDGELLVAMERADEGDFGVMVYGKGPAAQEILNRRRGRTREITLVMEKPDGGRADITLLRSVEWIEAHGAQVGEDLFLDLPEMDAHGFAEVVDIKPCPPLELDGSHNSRTRLVTGVFRHTSGSVYDLKVESEHTPLGVTGTHPFWSCDRQGWVSAAELRIGETLRTLTGPTRVESIRKRPQPEAVFNIEMEGDHVYRVGESGVLVHNASVQECRNHKNTLETRPARGGDRVDLVFQRRACGQTEYRVVGGGQSAWADTIEGCDIVDCKAVRTPRSSPALGTAPDFIEQSFRTQELGLLRRYEAVIDDACTPYDKLIIVVDRESARPFWQSLLNQLSIPSAVEIRSADLNS